MEKMNFELKSIHTKRLVLFLVLGLLGAIFITIPLSKNREELEEIFIFLTFLIAFFVLGYQLSIIKTRIDFSLADRFLIDGHEFVYKEIEGYHKPEDAAISAAFSFKTSDKQVHHIIALSNNKEKDTLEDIEKLFLKKLSEENPDARILSYNELHEKQLNYLRPIIIGLIGLVVVFDAIFFLFLFKTDKFPHQLIWVNAVALGMLPLLRKNRTAG